MCCCAVGIRPSGDTDTKRHVKPRGSVGAVRKGEGGSGDGNTADGKTFSLLTQGLLAHFLLGRMMM